jgi:aryl-alcohol dehydrogenase-like predicted oxidoreductase
VRYAMPIQIAGRSVSRLGLGCMGMSWGYERSAGSGKTECIATLHAALDAGITLFDTAEVYGPYENEQFLGDALRTVLLSERERITIATKFGFEINAKGKIQGACGTPENAKRALEGSLRRLGIDHVDVYYLHRKDPQVPIEESVGAMAALVREGKARAIGLSEVSAATLRRAHAVHPVAAVQSEYSLFERHAETEVLPACRELGITFVAYSPLGRGLLTGKSKAAGAYAKSDSRRMFPRFQGENYERNLARIAPLFALASARHVAPASLALGWLLSRPQVLPLFGTTRRVALAENLAAMQLPWNDALDSALSEAFPLGAAFGERYHAGGLRLVES